MNTHIVNEFLKRVRTASVAHVVSLLGVLLLGALIDRGVHYLQNVSRDEDADCVWQKLVHDAMAGARDGLNRDQCYRRLVRINTQARFPIRDADALVALSTITLPIEVPTVIVGGR